jgi:hypothetical protein
MQKKKFRVLVKDGDENVAFNIQEVDDIMPFLDEPFDECETCLMIKNASDHLM